MESLSRQMNKLSADLTQKLERAEAKIREMQEQK
jgi:hypothetical protein